MEDLKKRLLAGAKDFTGRELSSLLDVTVYDDYDEPRRWTRTVTSVIEVEGRYFEIVWEQGLTENQENEYYNQPIEVEKKEKTVTEKVIYYTPINNESTK